MKGKLISFIFVILLLTLSVKSLMILEPVFNSNSDSNLEIAESPREEEGSENIKGETDDEAGIKTEAETKIEAETKTEAETKVKTEVNMETNNVTKGESKPGNNSPATNFGNSTFNLPAASKSEVAVFEDKVIALINDERSKQGLALLKIDNEVRNLTRIKSEDMRDNDYFSTTSPTHGTLTDMLKNNNVEYRLASEKIAGGNKTPEEVFKSWMKDAKFRESISKANFTHIGVGYADGGGKYSYYWTLWLIEKPSPIDSGTKSSYEREVLRLVNIERTNRGLNPLEWDDAAAKVARAKSTDMRDKNYFAHESPTYGSLSDMLKHFNISYSSAAENLAAGQKTPEDAVKGWMNSEGHRKNILDPKLTHLGVGYADGGGDYYVYWTQIFITKP